MDSCSLQEKLTNNLFLFTSSTPISLIAPIALRKPAVAQSKWSLYLPISTGCVHCCAMTEQICRTNKNFIFALTVRS